MGTATVKQINFINTLLSERDLTPADEQGYRTVIAADTFGPQQASRVITALMKLPRKARPAAAAAPSAWAEAQERLRSLDISFYAVPAQAVMAQEIDLNGNDYLFLRTRNYMGKTYLSRVYGAYGAPRYQKIGNPRLVTALAAILAEDGGTYAENWHKVSGNCGRCNATLTDAESRERGFGPDCWKIIRSRA